MCFFEQTLWACGWWRWGNFRQQCNKEYRMGETCGLKLVYETETEPDVCKLCHDTEKKQRRYDKMYRDVQRWQREGNRSATKVQTTIIEIGASLAPEIEMIGSFLTAYSSSVTRQDGISWLGTSYMGVEDGYDQRIDHLHGRETFYFGQADSFLRGFSRTTPKHTHHSAAPRGDVSDIK
ncbi:hypothetical protein FDECE_13486 [Fusarium decemcellulare]|nr:hypothetical protein FDECE_13486 [Fusarium decemcellulare]